jgi:hypothetical protein
MLHVGWSERADSKDTAPKIHLKFKATCCGLKQSKTPVQQIEMARLKDESPARDECDDLCVVGMGYWIRYWKR